MDQTTDARIRAAAYVTRTVDGRQELLVFDYLDRPEAGVHLPGGGIDPGERPEDAVLRETIEETGIAGELGINRIVGIQQGWYNTGAPCVSIYFHVSTDELRDQWTHTTVGDPGVWDTGLMVRSRFLPLPMATEMLRRSGYGQEEYIGQLEPVR